MVIAGEASGDMHGSRLVSEIKKLSPHTIFYGIGGTHMEKEGVKLIYHVNEMSFLGFFEVIKHLPFIKKVYTEMTKLLNKLKPDLVILIDYPGFNIRFAKEPKKKGIPVIYYISPQVWAWKKKRIKTIAERISKMLVIFPFEADLYKNEGVNVSFIGHPLKDVVKTHYSKKDFFNRCTNLKPENPTLCLLPGSRKQEVEKLLPEMIKGFKILKKQIPKLQGVIGMSNTLPENLYTSLIKDKAISLIKNEIYDAMAHSDAALVASGTATLETAILGTPMIILYKMSPISYLIGKSLVNLNNFGLVNIVAGKQIVPELLQNQVTGKNISDNIYPFFNNTAVRKKTKAQLKRVKELLGSPGAAKKGAEAIIELFNE